MKPISYAFIFIACFHCLLQAGVHASWADDLRAFDEWYQGMNKNDKVRLELIDDEPVLVATTNLVHTELTVLAPYDVFISSETVENDAVLGDIIEDIFDENEADQGKPIQLDSLYVYYLYHKFCDNNDAKFLWRLYFNALPASYETTLFFSNEDLEQLKGSIVYDLAVEERKTVEEKFKHLNEKLFEKQPDVFGKCKPTLKQFKWSYATVMSRKIDLIHTSKTVERKFVAVVPYFDFMRHYPFPKVEWGYSASTSMLHCEAHENIRKGQEVLRSYGELSNGELLKEQGYILDQNTHNAVLFASNMFVVDKADQFREKKQQVVDAMFKQSKYMRMVDGGLSQELMEIAKTLSSRTEKVTDSVDTMYRAFLYLEKLCERRLSLYPTTLEEDETFMESAAFEQLTNRAKNARQVILEEKDILETMKGEFAAMARKKLNEAKKRGIEIDLKDEL